LVPSPVAVRLRERTAATHERVEAGLNLLDPALSATRLREVLARFAGFWHSTEQVVEQWAQSHPDAAAALSWRRRRRSEILRQDLMSLGMTGCAIAALPQAPDAFVPHAATEAQVLGWLYVSEGSTLGGAVIDRAGQHRPGSPLTTVRTFRPYVEGPGPMWRSYLDYLHGWVGDDPVRGNAVVAAGQTSFAALEQWLAPISSRVRVMR
jgi:heme oxygenase